jgi:hypothetical protein
MLHRLMHHRLMQRLRHWLRYRPERRYMRGGAAVAARDVA